LPIQAHQAAPIWPLPRLYLSTSVSSNSPALTPNQPSLTKHRTSAVYQTLYGRISDIWSRKSVLLAFTAIFLLGNLASSLAQTFTQIFVFRVIVAIGGGRFGTVGQIMVSDVVSLRQSGRYQGILGLSVALANGVGPLIGGALAGTLS
ncbi:hypothetical protein FS749_004511, partial [Ceratobasidium sp. UAMH 11750]